MGLHPDIMNRVCIQGVHTFCDLAEKCVRVEAQLKREKKRAALNHTKVAPLTCEKVQVSEVSSSQVSIPSNLFAPVQVTRYEPKETLPSCNSSHTESNHGEPKLPNKTCLNTHDNASIESVHVALVETQEDSHVEPIIAPHVEDHT